MAKRNIIEIDEDKCTGCAKCIPNCPEGALKIIDGKARLISDLFCDGLKACVGHCPHGAMKIVEREAKPYDEAKVMENIIRGGPNTIKQHLMHLKEQGELKLLKEAKNVLISKGIGVPDLGGFTCPGAGCQTEKNADEPQKAPSPGQWPIQLHLVNPLSQCFAGQDLVLAADCCAYAGKDFHSRLLKSKSLAIACPKLDSEQKRYVEKIRLLIDESRIDTLTVVMMEVPCCGGLMVLAKDAAKKAKRKVPLKSAIIGVGGQILREEWEQ